MIKTIVSIPNFVYNPAIDAMTAVINNQSDQWYNDGKHDNHVNRSIDEQASTITIERWNWVDEAAATDYKNFVLATVQESFPGVQVDIVTQ